MAEYTRVARIGEIKPNEGKRVTIQGVPIAVFNVGGRFYAIDDSCSHAGGPLGDGWVEGSTVTCPWHGWRFDVVTGRSADGMGEGLRTYPVRVDGEELFVAV